MNYIENNLVTYAKQHPTSKRGGVIIPKFIVMHYTAGFTAQSALNAYENRNVSAHLTVDTDATVYQSVPYNRAAWHAGPSRHMGYSGLNQHSIGIEIVNAGWFRRKGDIFYRDNISKHKRDMPKMVARTYSKVGGGIFWWPEYTKDQLDAVESLTKDILSEYNILDIVGHEDIDTRGWKTDPGPLFPMERYKRLLTAAPHRDLDSDLYEVTAKRLNVRFGPGTNFKVKTSLGRTTTVSVIDEDGDWCRINDEGDTDGWVHKAYIRRV